MSTAFPSFFDTNILVYAFDGSAGQKNATASELLATHLKSESLRISTQVLIELYVTLSRKIPKPLALEAAAEIVTDLSHCEHVVVDSEVIYDAMKTQRIAKLSFWDALILEAAVRAGAEQLYSEDMQHGFKWQGIKVVNPFKS